jgi:hypothetical protein
MEERWARESRLDKRKDKLRMGSSSKDVETRAEGRPPEEAESDNPKAQAEAILDESEDRLKEAAQKSANEKA